MPTPTTAPAPTAELSGSSGNETNTNDASSANNNENSSNDNGAANENSSNDNTVTEPPASINLDPFASTNINFDSYTIKFLVDFSGADPNGNEVTQMVSASINIVNDPQAMSMTFIAEGIEGADEFGNLSMAQIGDTAYMVLPGMGCITSSTEELNLFEDNPFEDIFSSNDFVEDLSDAEYAGTETINGIETDHYILDKNALNLDPEQQIDSAEGHLYLAKDGGYPVKLVIDGVGEFDMFEDSGAVGEFHVELNLTNINSVGEIVPPEDCAGASDSEYPVLDDATNYSSFGGLINYNSGHSVKDAVAFYDTELADQGWTKNEGDSFVTDTSAIMSYTQDNVTLSLIINDEGDGTISVTIIADDGSGG
ncbi:MAG: hypothetical protein ACE5EY_00430 [Anaerolineae bacterium]